MGVLFFELIVFSPNPIYHAWLLALRPRRRIVASRTAKPNPHAKKSNIFHTLAGAFTALSIPSFRAFFIGQSISLIGSWVQHVALGWLIYRLTGSMVLLGVVGFAGQIPSLLITPLAGVLADKHDRRIVLLAVQCVPMLLAAVMALLIFTNTVAVWHIILMAILSGCAMAFDTPFRHALLFDLVGERQYLSNAIAMNSTMINAARFLGPLLGGVLIAWIGEASCFLLNALSFIPVVFALASVRVHSHLSQTLSQPLLASLADGVRYAFAFRPIRDLLLLVAAVSLIAMPLQVFLPAFAKSVLQGDATHLGALTGAMGAGALTGALFLATRRSVRRFPLQIYTFALLMGIGFVIFSRATSLLLAIPALYLAGLVMIALFASTNTYLQAIVHDQMRGRVIALYGMTFMGITPLGSLMLGGVAKSIGLPHTLLGCGILSLLIALAFRPSILPIVRNARQID